MTVRGSLNPPESRRGEERRSNKMLSYGEKNNFSTQVLNLNNNPASEDAQEDVKEEMRTASERALSLAWTASRSK